MNINFGELHDLELEPVPNKIVGMPPVKNAPYFGETVSMFGLLSFGDTMFHVFCIS